MQHVKNFDGFERDFLKFAEQQGIPVDKKSVVGLYQFRAQELMKQNGINPKSELGLKLQNSKQMVVLLLTVFPTYKKILMENLKFSLLAMLD